MFKMRYDISPVMKILTTSPTKALIESATDLEMAELRRQLTYTNTSLSFQISKLMKHRWFRQNHPKAWQEKVDDLKSRMKQTLVFKDGDGKTFIRPGSIKYLSNMQIQVENRINYPESKLIAWGKKPPFEPYSYQTEAVGRLISEKHGAVSLPTGSGKSLILQLLTKNLGLQTAVIVPTKGIFLEVLEDFERAFGKNKVGAFGNGKKDIKKQITVCIAKSISMIKPGSDEEAFFKAKQVLIADEAHLFASTELEKICHNYLASAPYRFFLSGTQTRGDGSVPLLQSITGPIVYEMTTKDGIEFGSLSPLEFRIVSVDPGKKGYDTSDAAKMKSTHLLYNENVINKAAEIANNMAKLGENTLILVEEIEQISLLIKKLKVPYVYTHGNTTKIEDLKKMGLDKTDLRESLEKFHKKIDGTMVLIGTENISIGVNTFAHNGINLQGGASEIGTKQGIIGRMVRITQKSKFSEFHKEKKTGRIWDFRIKSHMSSKGEMVDYSLMEKHLQKRIGFYKETGGKIMEV